MAKKEKPFLVARQRTAKGEAAARAQVMMDKMAELMEITEEKVLLEKIEAAFGITPDSPQFAAIMNVWRTGGS